MGFARNIIRFPTAKEVEDQLKSDKVKAKIKVTFLWLTVYIVVTQVMESTFNIPLDSGHFL